MPKPVRIFHGSTGLHTKTDPVRIGNEDGRADLAVALNVDISDSYRVRRRQGYAKKSSIGGHSLFCDEGPCLFVSGSSLCELASDFSHRVLGTIGAGHRRMRYAQATDGNVYFGNGVDKGMYRAETGTIEPWIADVPNVGAAMTRFRALRDRYFAGEIGFAEYSEGAEEELRKAEVYYDSPLPPSHLEFYRGRIYTAYENFVLYSEPWAFSWFNLFQNFIPFRSRVSMIRRTADGLFVGTKDGIFYLGGAGPSEFSSLKVSPDPPVEHTDIRVPAEDVTEDARGDAAMWTSVEGICFGGPGGTHFDFTKRRVDFPVALEGTAIAYNGAYLSVITV
jgi:hypothetical protein